MSRSEASSWVTRSGGRVPVREMRRVVRDERGRVRDGGRWEREARRDWVGDVVVRAAWRAASRARTIARAESREGGEEEEEEGGG